MSDAKLREALEKFVVDGGPVVGMINANDFAPIIEKALRAAYIRGGGDQLESGFGDGFFHPDRGVTAGVAAMEEGS